MKNIRISFRLSEYHLAKALQTIRALEPSYQLTSPSELVKVIFHDYLSKMNLSRTDTISTEIHEELQNFLTTSPASKKNISLQELIKLDQQTKQTPSAIDDPNDTDSAISSVTDFSPPKDWTK